MMKPAAAPAVPGEPTTKPAQQQQVAPTRGRERRLRSDPPPTPTAKIPPTYHWSGGQLIHQIADRGGQVRHEAIGQRCSHGRTEPAGRVVDRVAILCTGAGEGPPSSWRSLMPESVPHSVYRTYITAGHGFTFAIVLHRSDSPISDSQPVDLADRVVDFCDPRYGDHDEGWLIRQIPAADLLQHTGPLMLDDSAPTWGIDAPTLNAVRAWLQGIILADSLAPANVARRVRRAWAHRFGDECGPHREQVAALTATIPLRTRLHPDPRAPGGSVRPGPERDRPGRPVRHPRRITAPHPHRRRGTPAHPCAERRTHEPCRTS